MLSSEKIALSLLFLASSCLSLVVEASDQQIVYIRNNCECWSTDLRCVCKIESDPTSIRPLMQRLVNRTAEYYWQEVEFQSMVYDRTTFVLANTFADGPFPSAITFKGDFSIVNDSFNHLNMTMNKVELNFETFSGRKPKFSKQYWRYIFDHGEATLRSLRIIKYQIEDFVIPNYLGAALTQESRPLTEFKVTGCEVKEVRERAFKNFTQLELIDLSDNHLTTLPENIFSRNINLQKILLANNQISFLTKTIFDGLPNLLLINLRKNKLTAVPAIPRHTNRRFQPMVYLMADNSIHCRCSLIWVLHELTFHHNLEIEATCSDPTMVRGMPIIEGFTRMDKEACYRIVARMADAPYPPYLSAPGSMGTRLRFNPPQIGDNSQIVEGKSAGALDAADNESALKAAGAAIPDEQKPSVVVVAAAPEPESQAKNLGSILAAVAPQQQEVVAVQAASPVAQPVESEQFAKSAVAAAPVVQPISPQSVLVEQRPVPSVVNVAAPQQDKSPIDPIAQVAPVVPVEPASSAVPAAPLAPIVAAASEPAPAQSIAAVAPVVHPANAQSSNSNPLDSNKQQQQ